MTVSEFLEAHGDPAQWSDKEYEDFIDFATPDPQPNTPTPTAA